MAADGGMDAGVARGSTLAGGLGGCVVGACAGWLGFRVGTGWMGTTAFCVVGSTPPLVKITWSESGTGLSGIFFFGNPFGASVGAAWRADGVLESVAFGLREIHIPIPTPAQTRTAMM